MNFFVEGVAARLSNPNKPSTKPLGDAYMVGKIPGTDVHWGFAVGILLCIALYFLLERTTFGFAARVTGGNFRAALAQGLPVGRLIVACSADRRRLRRARRLLRSGGDPGPRQRFARRRLRLHRHSGLVPGAAQSARHLRRSRSCSAASSPPAASSSAAWVCPTRPCWFSQGLIFVVLLTSETLYGRFSIFKPRAGNDRT